MGSEFFSVHLKAVPASKPFAVSRNWLPGSPSRASKAPDGLIFIHRLGASRWLRGKESACQCRSYRKNGFHPWVRMIPWRRKWKLTPGFLPGKFHRQRSLEGYSPWGRRGLGKTKWLTQTSLPVVFCNVPSGSSQCSPVLNTNFIIQVSIVLVNTTALEDCVYVYWFYKFS